MHNYNPLMCDYICVILTIYLSMLLCTLFNFVTLICNLFLILCYESTLKGVTIETKVVPVWTTIHISVHLILQQHHLVKLSLSVHVVLCYVSAQFT